MLKKLIFFLIFLPCLNLFSQNKTKTYKDSIAKYIYNDPDQAINISHKFLKSIENSKQTENKILSYSILGIAYEIKNEIDSTLYYYQKCLNLVNKPIDIVQYKYSIGVIYENEYNYKDALELYDQALKIARQEKNDFFIYEIKSSIASIKNKIGQSKDALVLILEVYERNKSKKNNNLKFNRKTLIETYLNSKMTAEADVLIKEGLQEALETNNFEFLYYLYKLKSESNFIQNQFDEAIDNAKKALKNAKNLANNEFIDEANYTLAMSFFKKENYDFIITTLNNIIQNHRSKTLDQNAKYYKLLADTYKQVGNDSLSNECYQRYIKYVEKVNKNRLSTLESIHSIILQNQVSDIENTFESELKEEILEKDKHKKTKFYWIIAFIILVIIGSFIVIKFIINQKQNQVRFNNLMLKIKDYESNDLKTENLKSEDKDLVINKTPSASHKQKEILVINETIFSEFDTEEVEEGVEEELEEELEEGVLESEVFCDSNSEVGFNIDDEKINEILQKIERLEDKKYYLRQDCTLHNMAKRLKTNTSYLSKIINSHLDKSFSTYINELRVNYAIIELKNNKRLRSYSVKGIAQELGYKNADAFSKYFKAATGITPSVYIKKIEEL